MKINNRTKRDSLEEFTREQLSGPGAYNFRYYFEEDINSSDIFNTSFKSGIQKSIDEVILEVPAYQYSTAILFPEVQECFNEILIEEKNEDEEFSEVDSSKIEAMNSDELVEPVVTDNLQSKSQSYPTTFGLSFVVKEDANLEEDYLVEFSYNTYHQVKKEDLATKKKLCIYIDKYEKDISDIVVKYYEDYLEIIQKGDNLFLTYKEGFIYSKFEQIDIVNTSNFALDTIVRHLRSLDSNSFDLEYEKHCNKEECLTNDKNLKLYSILEKQEVFKKIVDIVTIDENSLVRFITKHLNQDKSNFDNIEGLVKSVEIFYQLNNYIATLKSIFLQRKKQLPVWKASSCVAKIQLPKYNQGKIERNASKTLIEGALNYSVQYLKSDKNQGVYVKVLINNINVFMADVNERQINKKDEANEKSFFNVCLKVQENKPRLLLPYNSYEPNDLEEEDRFTKSIYRNFKDYGEGYNTSVTWGTNDDLLYVSTEFLPSEQTPNVDFEPSKIEDNEVKSRLSNQDVLAIRNLSTLSKWSDNHILEALTTFIDSYQVWIDDKKKELDKELELDSTFNLLDKQLEACRLDYSRLKRNLKILETNTEALAAFKLMNTAMFMQLYHSILIKKDKEKLHELDLDESYYRDVVLKEEYKWRSFQLAFILLNIDGFVKPGKEQQVLDDLFQTGWPERNEIADLVWFPTGGGKTEAYLGIIAFCICYRRFTKKDKGYGTTVIMRYTLRLLTLQQFQRATVLICALEVIRKSNFKIPNSYTLGTEKVTIGLFVGNGSLPNKWKGLSTKTTEVDDDMFGELKLISDQIKEIDINAVPVNLKTKLPFTSCPWCGEDLFTDFKLPNVLPNVRNDKYGKNDQLHICCNNKKCSFGLLGRRNHEKSSLPFLLFDEDIYKFPPTLLFGTVDKFAALANKVSTDTSKRNEDSRRFFGKGYKNDNYPPELIIQDELHLLLGPLGTSVGLFEKAIDKLCTYSTASGEIIKPKIITSTATTRNTNRQIFALFNRRSEIFPKQGITADDSFFAYYKRDSNGYISNRKYLGILPVGKTQVWMQLRVASIALTHRLKYMMDSFSMSEILGKDCKEFSELRETWDYFHTVLSYFNSLKEVGKTQSQLSHYLPNDVNYVIHNTVSWTIIDKLFREEDTINYSELTGRLSGEEIKTNLSEIEKKWNLYQASNDSKICINNSYPPDFVISTNMISVGIDVSRFNTMIISSMPRNIAEYIQASSRVARSKEGIVFTIHHPFRSRDISHYQRFKEFHEKFYSYVEPISVTPFATKALERYFAMYLAVIIRHTEDFGIMNNNDASKDIDVHKETIQRLIKREFQSILNNATVLEEYLQSDSRKGIKSTIDGIISEEELNAIIKQCDMLLDIWISKRENTVMTDSQGLVFRSFVNKANALFGSKEDIDSKDSSSNMYWKVGQSLREIDPSTVIKTFQQ